MLILKSQDMHATMLFELRSLPPKQKAKIVRLRDRYEALISRTLEEGQAAGVLRSDVPLKHIKLALLNLMNWSIVWYHKGGELEPEDVADMLVRIYFEGAAPVADARKGSVLAGEAKSSRV
jgi:hypothetical protein